MGVKYGAPYYTSKTKNGMKIKIPILQNYIIYRNAQNNACRDELGRFPLLLPIQKKAVKFMRSSEPGWPTLLPAQGPEEQPALPRE